MGQLTQYQGAGFTAPGDNAPSPAIWADCPWLAILEGSVPGIVFHDDFENHNNHISDTSVQTYDTFITTGVQAIARAGVAAPFLPGGGVGGVLLIDGNNADNDVINMTQFGAPWVVTDDVDPTAAPIAKKLWFEARIALESVANNNLGWFVGLAHDFGAGVTVAKADALTANDGALGAFSFLGFHTDCANGDSIDCVYKSDAGAQTVNLSGIQASAVDTFYRLGFVFDPSAPAAKRITWYVQGVKQSTYVTGTQIAAAAFPDLEPMGLALLTLNGDGASAAHEFYMDWWRCAQLR